MKPNQGKMIPNFPHKCIDIHVPHAISSESTDFSAFLVGGQKSVFCGGKILTFAHVIYKGLHNETRYYEPLGIEVF